MILNSKAESLTLSAMFMALGVIVPVLFHAVGLGSMFLPMFWPMAACVFFLPVRYATLVGLLTPVISFFFTGMPPISPPILQLIIGELFILTLTAGLLYHHTRWGTFWISLLGLTVSRFALFLMVMPFARILGLPPALASTAVIIKGIPGIVLILILVPILVNRIKGDKIWRIRQ